MICGVPWRTMVSGGTVFEVRLNQPMLLDAKGRLTLPARLRSGLETFRVSSLVFIVHEGHLRAYTPADFSARVEQPLAGLDAFEADAEEKQRLRLGFATEVDVDRQGRLVIPANLRLMAGIDREVVVISLLERLEFWDPVRLQEWYAARHKKAVLPGVAGGEA